MKNDKKILQDDDACAMITGKQQRAAERKGIRAGNAAAFRLLFLFKFRIMVQRKRCGQDSAGRAQGARRKERKGMGGGDREYCIRMMTRQDLAQAAALEAQTFTDAWSLRLWEQSLEQKSFCGLVLTLPGEREEPVLAGYICGQFVMDEGEIHRIAVASSLRREGYGQALLESFLHLGMEKGISRFFLEVRAGNRPARALYEKNAFVCLGTRKNYYQNPKEDVVILEKIL